MSQNDEKKSPKSVDEQDAPAPERPTNTQEDAGQGPEDKPSQAEGERAQARE